MPFATVEGTRRYAERFTGRAADGHFRETRAGLCMSSVGIGTYLGDPDARTDQAYTDAVVAAVRAGANVIDSASNYRFQRSERSIGAALTELAAGFAREELVLCTKGGYLTPDGEMPANPREYFQREYFDRGICRPDEIAGGAHCMAPRYLEDQLARSLRNLGVDCVDVYYLHNAAESQLGEVPRKEFQGRLRAAFAWLESAVAAGKVRYYGMATWNSFRQDPKAADYTSLEEIVAVAREAGGNGHHFGFVQVPFNLGMTEALTRANQPVRGEMVPMVKAADELGITLVGSASLLQGRLAQGLPERVERVFALGNNLLNALQFARSSPGIATALVGMSRVEHVTQNLRLASVPPAPMEQFMKLFEQR